MVKALLMALCEQLSTFLLAPSILARVGVPTILSASPSYGLDERTSSPYCIRNLKVILLSCSTSKPLSFIGGIVQQIWRSSLLQELSKFHGPHLSNRPD